MRAPGLGAAACPGSPCRSLRRHRGGSPLGRPPLAAGAPRFAPRQRRVLAGTHVLPSLGARKLRDLSAHDVDRWLEDKAGTLSTRTLRLLHSMLNRAVIRAMARDKVRRNVVVLCGIPNGQDGRPSKSLTLPQAKALLAAAENSRLRAYVVVSLLTRARTEELRALTWDHVDLDGQDHREGLSGVLRDLITGVRKAGVNLSGMHGCAAGC